MGAAALPLLCCISFFAAGCSSVVDLSYSVCVGAYDGSYERRVSPSAEACVFIDPIEGEEDGTE